MLKEQENLEVKVTLKKIYPLFYCIVLFHIWK